MSLAFLHRSRLKALASQTARSERDASRPVMSQLCKICESHWKTFKQFSAASGGGCLYMSTVFLTIIHRQPTTIDIVARPATSNPATQEFRACEGTLYSGVLCLF